jgi:hypothetical protein
MTAEIATLRFAAKMEAPLEDVRSGFCRFVASCSRTGGRSISGGALSTC